MRNSVARTIFISFVAFSFSTQVFAGNSERINTCIAKLHKSDSRLKNYWKGSCGEDSVDAVFKENGFFDKNQQLLELQVRSGDRITVRDNGVCDDLGRSPAPISSTASCGRGSSYLDEQITANPVVQIRLPGGRCQKFIPVLLTNKKGLFACNAVQSRIACLDAKYDPTRDTTTIKMFVTRNGPTDQTTIIVGPDWQRGGQRLDDLITHPQFALIPASIEVSNGDHIDLATRVREAIKEDIKACIKLGKTREHCDQRAHTRADSFMQAWMRRERNPKRYSTKEQMLFDGKQITNDLVASHIDQNKEKWFLFWITATNEVGLKLTGHTVAGIVDPIYGVSDAINDDSGLSFGAHQIDIGANDKFEADIMWNVISSYLRRVRTSQLTKAVEMRECIDLPIRYMTVVPLKLMYGAAGDMTLALRSNEGQKEYNERIKTYLQTETSLMAKLPGFFKNSMIARMAFADRRNQSGPKGGKAVKDIVDDLAGSTLSSCTDVEEIENELVDKLKKRLPGYADRFESIRTIVHAHAPSRGHSNCS